MAFVRRPRFIDNEDGIQLFEDKIEDEGRKRSFEANVLVIGMVVTLCLYMSYLDSTLYEFAWNIPLYFIPGSLLAWTFIEYFFHRFILHTEVDLDKSKKANAEELAHIFSRHVHHHVFMN